MPALSPLAVYLSTHGVSLRELALGMGVDPSTVSRWLSGARSLPPSWRELFPRALKVIGKPEPDPNVMAAIAAWQEKFTRIPYRASQRP